MLCSCGAFGFGCRRAGSLCDDGIFRLDALAGKSDCGDKQGSECRSCVVCPDGCRRRSGGNILSADCWSNHGQRHQKWKCDSLCAAVGLYSGTVWDESWHVLCGTGAAFWKSAVLQSDENTAKSRRIKNIKKILTTTDIYGMVTK